ncbi:MAG: aminoacyl-tRNA hydrolase, partial [Bacillota bacterium]
LGNPGERYKDTLHNMGYKAIEALEEKLGLKCKRALCSSLVAEKSFKDFRVVLAKPVTFMNLSGQAVKSLLTKYNIAIENLIVIYDDIDLPRYAVRARKEGGGGTHNGMKNIIELLGDNNFKRIRIGIGKEGDKLRDYVLSPISKGDLSKFKESFEKVADELISYIGHKDFEKLMRNLNTNK